MKIIFIIFFLINICNVISGQYLINDKIPSYLYYKFNNVEEKIFSFDMRINISLSRIDGDLLYSIDKNMNQLIVSLSDEIESGFKIQFRKKEYYVSFFKLCGCERCLYEIIDLRIKIRKKIALQCNDKKIKYFKYDINEKDNEIYPVLHSKSDTGNEFPNEVHLWLVNHEEHKIVNHNPFQLLGCIFNVWYDKNEINFTRISDNVERKCTRICVGDICNGGKCYETYDSEPVCDCTKTFLSGTYCNDTINSINRRFLSSLNFDLLKISWNSSVNELLLLKNSNVEIQMHVVLSILYFDFKYTDGHEIYMNGIISKSYTPNTEYILIIHFLRSMIDIQFFNKGNWSYISMPTYRDLTKEIFTSSSIQSGDGYIDLSYMISPKEYIWHKVNIEKYEEISKEKVFDAKIQDLIKKERIEFVSLVMLILLLVFVFIRLKRYWLTKTLALKNCIKYKIWNKENQHEKIKRYCLTKIILLKDCLKYKLWKKGTPHGKLPQEDDYKV